MWTGCGILPVYNARASQWASRWTNDRYHPDGFGGVRQTDPVSGGADASNLTGPHIYYGDARDSEGFPMYRVARGGWFDLWPVLAVSGRRMDLTGAGPFTGFRVVWTLDVEQGP